MSAETPPPGGKPANDEVSSGPGAGWTRENVLILVLIGVTVVLCVMCYRLLQPFLSALAWAVALAVVAHPLHEWIARRFRRPDLSAGLAVVLVAIVIIAPAGFVMHQLASQVARVMGIVQSGELLARGHEMLGEHPQVAQMFQSTQEYFTGGGAQQQIERGLGMLQSFITGSVFAAVELLITLFFLFYLFRDRSAALGTLRSLVPLSRRETDEVFTRVADTIYATIYGTLAVAGVQGALGGIMFWFLGLPAPLLWGVIMGLLAIVPVLGAFVVWAPAAVYLFLTGAWVKALILVGWGGIVISLIDNLLYPMLVGNRMRLHTVPVFVAIVGGLSLFGAAGLVLGPVVLSITHALIDIWRRRVRGGRDAAEAVA